MGDKKYYKYISALIFFAFVVNALCLIALNSVPCVAMLSDILSIQKILIVELFFWSALGATVSCSLFLAEDKEINELEACKEKPDPRVLRYPDALDVQLYAQRIVTSGVLGLIGAFLLFAGLGYFDIPIDDLKPKHKVFLVLTSFLVGLYQKNFLTSLASLSKKILDKTDGK